MSTSSGVMDITFQQIENITNGFSDKQKVGIGNYGEVYKGVFHGKEIAVKKLFILNAIDDKAFTNEFRNLMKVQHQNIIRLVGYCYETKHKHIEHKGELVFAKEIERALCFEYMQQGSLARHISDESFIHDWPTAYKVVKGTCEGLHYLHKGREEHIYHLDLKPDNILLDNNLVPKITDFGLSRLFGTSKTHVTSTTAKGTMGFMPPEYIDHGVMSPKNDVFSLGVIIFQMMAGKHGYSHYCESPSPQEFIERVQEIWKRKLQATVRHTSHEIDALVLGVKKCAEIAVRCVERNRDKRPGTLQIIDELNKLDAQIAEMLKNAPKPPAAKRDWGSKDIAVDPSLELRFPFEPQRSISCCLQLTNKSDSIIAFDIKADRSKYAAWPSKGTMPPCSRRYITVTMRAQEKAPDKMRCHDVLIVRGTRVGEGLRPNQVTADLFEKKASEEGTAAVDEVTLPIVFVGLEDAPPHSMFLRLML